MWFVKNNYIKNNLACIGEISSSCFNNELLYTVQTMIIK